MGFKGLIKKGSRSSEGNVDRCALSPHMTKDAAKKKQRPISLPINTVRALQAVENVLVLKTPCQSTLKADTSLSHKYRLQVSRSRRIASASRAPSILKKSSTFSSASTATTKTVSSVSTITTVKRVNSFDSDYESTWRARLRVERGLKRSPSSKSGSAKLQQGRKNTLQVARRRSCVSGLPSSKKALWRPSLIDDRDETESTGSTETRAVSNAGGKTSFSRRVRSVRRVDRGCNGLNEDGTPALDSSNKACCDWVDPLEYLQEYANKFTISEKVFSA